MIYDYFMGSMMSYKTDPMCYIRIRPVLANLLKWNLGGVIKENRNSKNPIRMPTGTRTPRPKYNINILKRSIKPRNCFIITFMTSKKIKYVCEQIRVLQFHIP